MKRFTQLYHELDSSTKTTIKLRALTDYLRSVPSQDRLWAIALFTHRRPRRTISTAAMREWAAELSNVPPWLFEESYHIVGDLAEAISLCLPDRECNLDRSLSEWMSLIIAQKEKNEQEKKSFVHSTWKGLDRDQRFLFNKLITGGFRMGVSQKMITKALAKVIDEDENKVAHRLMGDWTPLTTTYETLLVDTDWKSDASKPYPFYLAHALDDELENLGKVSDWCAEWKWDGIRSQLIKREDQLFIWSRGEELVTDKYPELSMLSELEEDGFVIDGELLVYKDGEIRPFGELQKRIGRKIVGKKLLRDYPTAIFAYDLLEYKGEDLRERPLEVRRGLLKELVGSLSHVVSNKILISESIQYDSWDQLKQIRQTARERRAEGLMLKLKSGDYKSGRRRGEWWKWKLDPYTVDAVLLYAQRGHGRRSSLFTDFTFAVWGEDGALVPFAKAYSGLTDAEFKEVTNFVNKNTVDRFGPVRSITPELVFEIAFEGINTSKRHKCGVAVRFPRIKRWRRDKPANEANSLVDLKQLITG